MLSCFFFILSIYIKIKLFVMLSFNCLISTICLSYSFYSPKKNHTFSLFIYSFIYLFIYFFIFSATFAQVKTALQAITTIGIINVESIPTNSTGTLCSTTGTSILITFLTDHGDLPLITVSSKIGIDSFSISENVKGINFYFYFFLSLVLKN